MGKLFGEFLVEKKLVAPSQLLEALIVQLRSAPSTAEVLFEHTLLPQEEQLQILTHQQCYGTDYRTSARALNLWTDTLADEVAKALRKSRRPLGEVLVALGHLTTESLTNALDAYVESFAKSSALKTEAPAPAMVPTASEALVAPATPAARTQTLDPLLAAQFFDNFQNRVAPALTAIGKQLDEEDLDYDAYLILRRSALAEFSALRAAATFVGAHRTQQLASGLIDTMEALQSTDDVPSMPVLVDLIKTAVHLFDALSRLIKEFQSEDVFETDANLKDLLQRLTHMREQLRVFSATGS